MYRRIFLCVPHFPGMHEWPPEPPVGIGYLAEVLEKNDFLVEIMDLRLGHSVKDLIRKINNFRPDLVGIMAMSYRHDIPYELTRRVKEAGYKVVIGGPHVSLMRKRVLEECVADFAIKQEGEYKLLRLCKGESLKNIDGLIYRESDRIIENKDGAFLADLGNIPFPRYRNFELHLYSSGRIPIISSRGCPYSCTFCSAKMVSGRKWRYRNAKNIIDEITYWYGRGYRGFVFEDDNFSLDQQRVLEICDLIAENGLTGLTMSCGNGIRADRVSRDMLERMKGVGFNALAIGVEAGNNKVLKNIRKGETIEDMEKTIKDACDLGFNVRLYFLLGSPGETPQDLEDSIKLALRYPVSEAKFSNIIPFPSTELYEWLQDHNLFLVAPEKYLNTTMLYDDTPVFQTPEFPLDERRKALKRTKRIRRKIQTNYLMRSSISRFGTTAGSLLYPVVRLYLSDFFQRTRRSTIFRPVWRILVLIGDKLLGYASAFLL
ncbi:B12-binding domain-containing radical SAM protein [Chloroflexota bacterium]